MQYMARGISQHIDIRSKLVMEEGCLRACIEGTEEGGNTYVGEGEEGDITFD